MTDSVREQVATRLRMAREASGLSQGQAAKMMEMHRPTISEIEAGRRRVSAEELAKFASIYDVSVGWITSQAKSDDDPADEQIMLAARQLSKMKPADLDRLMSLLRMVQKRGSSK